MSADRDDDVVVADRLTRAFDLGRGTPPVVAANGVSFRIPRGGALGLVGESGSGKSTIARIVVGLERADSGALTIDGVDRFAPVRGPAARRARARQAQMVFQDPYGSLDRRLTVEQALVAAVRLHGGVARGDARSRAAELLDRVRLGSAHAASKPHQLSGGQRQRVAIARALAMSPSLLVLDEAVSALDVSVQAQILELVGEVRRDAGIAVLFVSHDLAVVDEVTDHVLVLFRGDVVEAGETRAMLRSPEHPYTQLLMSSVPGPGWDPHEVVKRRRAFDLAAAETRNLPAI